jgi:hypothetical protein
MERRLSFVLLVIGMMFTPTTIISGNNFLNQRAYAHMFTTDETASFLAFSDHLQVESELVQANLINNNLSLAQNHANKAAALLTPGIIVEIAETNQKVANDLTTAVNNLQKITSTSENQRQMVKQLVTDINATLSEAVNIRIEQGQDSSNFLEGAIEFLSGIFGGGSKEVDVNKTDRDKTTLPLAFADLVDSVLVNYGNAYAVDFDMTNMSNMVMMEGDSSSMAMDNPANDDGNSSNGSNSMNMDSMDMSSSIMMNMDSNNKGYSLVDLADYQGSQALAAKAQEIFNTELKALAPNNSSAFINNLENGLTHLNSSIEDKASPMDIMMIVHTQIHPNLLEAFT